MLKMRQKPFEAIQVERDNIGEVLAFVKEHLLVFYVDDGNTVRLDAVFDRLDIRYGDYLAYAGARLMIVRKEDAEQCYEVVK